MFNSFKEKILQGPQTTTIIVLNTLIFIIINILYSIEETGSLFKKGAGLGIAISFGEWWRLFTSGLLHSNLFHLLSNSIVLWIAGASVEKLIGRYYILFYIFSLIITACFSSFFYFLVLSVGSSGAVFAVLGYLWCAIFKQKDDLLHKQIDLTIGPQYLTYITIGGLIPTSAHVDYAAHISGFIFGFFFYYMQFSVIKNMGKSIIAYFSLMILTVFSYFSNPFPDTNKNLEAVRNISEEDEFEKNVRQCKNEADNSNEDEKYLKTKSCSFLIDNYEKINEVFKHEVEACKKGSLGSCKYMNYVYILIGKKELSIPFKDILCENNNYEHCHKIGNYYLWNEKYKESIPYYTKACDANLAGSCTQLGFAYYKLGYAVEDHKKYAEKGCSLGDYLGCFNLACSFCEEKNKSGAIVSFQKFIDLSEKNSIPKNDIEFIFTDKEIDCIRKEQVWIDYEKKFKEKK
jgi:rhomboid protease GluP